MSLTYMGLHFQGRQMMKCLALSLAFSFACHVFGDETLEAFESADGWKSSKGAQCEKAAGEQGLKFTQPGSTQKSYPYDSLKRADWDGKYKGVSFKIKGDGSDQFGSVIVGSAGWNYIYYFSVKDTEWTNCVVTWESFTLIGWGGSTQKFNSPGAPTPSGIDKICFGDRWEITHRNAKIPRFSYCVDDLRLVENTKSDLDVKSCSPRDFKEIADMLKKGAALSIACLGDSITAGTALKNPDKERYASLLQDKLRLLFKNDGINVASLGVGGAYLFDSIAWINRDFAGNPPDLVTLMIGFNNKSSGNPPESFAQGLRSYIDMVAAKTGGKSAILLIPTIPGRDYRFNMQDDYAQIVRDVAKERGLPVCDVHKAFKELGRDGCADYFADIAHPNAKGHELFANTLAAFLEKAAGK